MYEHKAALHRVNPVPSLSLALDSLDPSQLPSALVPQQSLPGVLTIPGPVAEIRLSCLSKRLHGRLFGFSTEGEDRTTGKKDRMSRVLESILFFKKIILTCGLNSLVLAADKWGGRPEIPQRVSLKEEGLLRGHCIKTDF